MPSSDDEKSLPQGNIRLTKQRKLVYDVFSKMNSRLTVEELYYIVKDQEPGIGLITVYRTLRMLSECGLLRRFRHNDGSFRYELTQKSFHHLICTKCGHIRESSDEELEKSHMQLAANNSFRVSHIRLELYGICQPCLLSLNTSAGTPKKRR